MRIIVDADSMRVRLREIAIGAARRHGLEAVFVANRPIPLPRSDATMVVAEDADEWIVNSVVSGELVVTHDVPLAARVIERGAEVLTDRGDYYNAENILPRLSERDFAMEMRRRGEFIEGGQPHGPREVQAFANALDRLLTAWSRSTAEASERTNDSLAKDD